MANYPYQSHTGRLTWLLFLPKLPQGLNTTTTTTNNNNNNTTTALSLILLLVSIFLEFVVSIVLYLCVCYVLKLTMVASWAVNT
jgi:hypothetical protein